MAPKLWLVTGCSTGFGRQFVKTILARGERVVATARNPDSIKDLGTLGAHCFQLDISVPSSVLKAEIAEIESTVGAIDVLINNASFTRAGAVEAVSEEELMSQFNTTFFGTVNVTKAVLPYMRARKSGTIIMITSVDAHVGRAGFGPYTASKHALQGMAACLRDDVKDLGIRVVTVAPGTFMTSAITPSNLLITDTEIPEYRQLTDTLKSFMDFHGKEPGDPAKLTGLVVDIVNNEGAFKDGEPIKHLPVGKDAWDELHEHYVAQVALMDKYKDVIRSTDFD